MSIFSWLREKRRDKTMDQFCTHLPSLGIDARVAPRGRPEEEIYTGADDEGSLGVIDIVEGPIRWINVTWGTRASVALDTSWVDVYHSLVFGVPDPKVRSGFPEVRLNAIPVRERERFWLSGRVIRVRWEGEDFGLGIVEHLSQNIQLPTASLESIGEVGYDFEIRARPDHGCWILTVEGVLAPSKQEWDCYQSIASALLAMPLQPTT